MIGPASTEPAAVAEAARLLLVALTVLGVITIDPVAIDAVVAGVAALASVGLTVWTRHRVTPADKTASKEQPPSG
jgi:hypothetical protein